MAHAEFDRDGSHVFVSVWEDDGAVIVYDANTLEEVKRLPMRKPSGKIQCLEQDHLLRRHKSLRR
ncbi:cytochrome D1 domain-containing protein [Jhaorihella thermophila]